MTKKGIVIFDGDDTLWKSQESYDDAKIAFAALLESQTLGDAETIPRLDALDAERVSTLGFSPERFSGSMLELYAILCRERGKEPNPSIESRIRKIGETTLKTPGLYEDTLPALQALKKDFVLVLATKGDPRVQANKIKGLGIEQFFHRIFIMPNKSEHDYTRIARELNAAESDIIVVGNSVKSDINPATRLGFKAYWIPRQTWGYEEAGLEEGDVSTAHSLSEVVASLMQPGGGHRGPTG